LVHWLDHIAAARVRPLTLEGYRSKVRTRIVPTLGHFRLDSLQPLTAEEARRVLAVAAEQRNAARDGGPPALQRQVGKGLVIVRPNSRAGRRVISLPGPLVAALRTHRAAQVQERLVAGSMWQNHLELVFTQPNRRPVDAGQDYQ